MAENSLTDSLNKLMGGQTAVNVGQTSPYTPPDPLAATLASIQGAYSAPASAATPLANAYTSSAAPATAREYLAGKGITPQAWRGMSAVEARPLRQEWRALKPAAGAGQPLAATPAAASPGANYQYWGQEWNDPLAQQAYKEVWLRNSPSAQKSIDQGVALAESYKGKPGSVFNSNLNPMNWGGGHIYNSPELRQRYIDLGGQAYNAYDYHAATDPASVGMPYDQATGEALGRVNAGVIEYPNRATGTWSTTKPANWAY